MKHKLNVRNLIGAFVGGVVGIMTCYYASLTFMPLGCLIGVVLGFWHDKLMADYDRNLTIVKDFLLARYSKFVNWKNEMMSYIKMPAEYIRRVSSKIPNDWGLGRHIIRGLVWFISLPLLFIAWLRKHPVNRANTITALLIPTIILLCWWSGYFSLTPPMMEKTAPAWKQIVGAGFFISSIFVVIGPVMLLLMRYEGGVEAFHRQYGRYNRYGPIGWVVYEVKNAIMLYTLVFIFAEIMILGVFGLLIMAGLTITVIATVVVPARTFWKCVKLPGHWFCFWVTIVTTLATWLLMRDRIINPAMAWTLALGNGIVAGVATEILRRSYERLVSKWDWLYELIHLEIDGDPEVVLKFLWRSFCAPVIDLSVTAWRKVQPRLPRIRLISDSFWLPV